MSILYLTKTNFQIQNALHHIHLHILSFNVIYTSKMPSTRNNDFKPLRFENDLSRMYSITIMCLVFQSSKFNICKETKTRISSLFCSLFKTFDRARCFQPSSPNPQSVVCPEEYIYNPDNIQQILMQKKLSETSSSSHQSGSYGSSQSSSWSSMHSHSSSSSSSSSQHSQSGSSSSFAQSEIVQISPQRVNLKLRASKYLVLKVCSCS